MLKVANIQPRDISVLNATLKGYKPACLTSSFTSFPVIDGLSSGIDKVSVKLKCKSGATAYNVYVLNKKNVLEIIKNNMSIFTARLGVNKESSPEFVYSVLTKALKEDKFIDDLRGIILGFPQKNSMIYNLEKFCGMSSKDRENTGIFKNRLLNALCKEDSPYINIDSKEINSLDEAIRNIHKVKIFNNLIYDFIEYTKEPAEMERIKKTTSIYKKSIHGRFLNIFA